MADGDDLVLGKNNNADAQTVLNRSGAFGAAPNTALLVTNNNGHGIYGLGTPGGAPNYGVGVFGQSSTYVGVYGLSSTSVGVRGQSSDNAGVYGFSQTASGVAGDSPDWFGVYGQSSTANGVRGVSNSGAGVHGFSVTGPGVTGTSQGRAAIRGIDEFAQPNQSTGVVGTSLNGQGVGGRSRTGVGVIGEWAPDDPASVANGGIGVLGRAHPAAGRGVVGFSEGGFAVCGSTVTGFAGVFDGNVFVRGNVRATGTKSAAVPLADGSTRLLYCIEGPQPWFEDVGRAELTDGQASVALDPDFATLIEHDDYHVFLTPEGDCNGLFVSDRGPDGFEVRELAGGTGTLQFSYRLVARRRDVPADRLPEMELPPLVDARGILEAEIPELPAVDLPSELPAVASMSDRISDPAVPLDHVNSVRPDADR